MLCSRIVSCVGIGKLIIGGGSTILYQKTSGFADEEEEEERRWRKMRIDGWNDEKKNVQKRIFLYTVAVFRLKYLDFHAADR